MLLSNAMTWSSMRSLLKRELLWRLVTLVVLFVASAIIFLCVANAGFSPCPVGKFGEDQKGTIDNLDKVIDLSLKLSTALVGFGAAALIGLRQGLKLGAHVKLSIAVATILFAQSALYAVWWRIGIAETYYNQCFQLVTSPRLQLRFEWHVYFFMLGLFAIAVTVVEALFREPPKEMDT